MAMKERTAGVGRMVVGGVGEARGQIRRRRRIRTCSSRLVIGRSRQQLQWQPEDAVDDQRLRSTVDGRRCFVASSKRARRWEFLCCRRNKRHWPRHTTTNSSLHSYSGVYITQHLGQTGPTWSGTGAPGSRPVVFGIVIGTE